MKPNTPEGTESRDIAGWNWRHEENQGWPHLTKHCQSHAHSEQQSEPRGGSNSGGGVRDVASDSSLLPGASV